MTSPNGLPLSHYTNAGSPSIGDWGFDGLDLIELGDTILFGPLRQLLSQVTGLPLSTWPTIPDIIDGITEFLHFDLGGLLDALRGEYTGSDVVLSQIQSWAGALGEIGQGIADLLSGVIPIGLLAPTTPNLLANGAFDGAVSMTEGEGWTWDATVGRDSLGSARFDATGVRGVQLSTPVQVAEGQKLDPGAWVKWSGVTASAGPAFTVAIRWWNDGALVSETVLGQVSSPPASSDWTSLGAEVTTPAGVSTATVTLIVADTVTAGQVWFDDAWLRKPATSIPQQWIDGLLDALGNIGDFIESIVNSLLGAVGLPALGDLGDRILDLADEIGDMFDLGQSTAGGLDDLLSGLLSAPAEFIGSIPQSLVSGLQGALANVNSYVQDLVNAILRAIRGIPVVGGTLADIIEEIGGLNTKAVEAKSTAVQAQADVVDLREELKAVSVTQQWVSLSTSDIASFPRVLLGFGPITHRHGSGSLSASTSTGNVSGNTSDTSVSMSEQVPGRNVASYVPLVVDRFCRPRYFKLITGDSGWTLGSLNAWYLSLYKYDPNSGTLNRIWNGGDLKGSISTRANLHAFDMGTSMGDLVPGEILFAAHVQSISGVLAAGRPIGTLWQPPLTDPSAEVLAAPHYTQSTSTLPTQVALSSLTPNRDSLPWLGIGTIAASGS